MSYTLRGVIGLEGAVRMIAEELNLPVVPLRQRRFLAPWTPEAFDALGRSEEQAEVIGLHYCHSTLAAGLRRASETAPVAYVEAECWAGQCEHGAVVLKDGDIAWLSEFGSVMSSRPDRRTPISEALGRTGVVAEGSLDEFDSLGLGANRHTEDWLPGSD